ncbi:MAG: cytochrome P450 [Gammaproteobacteria bacterium]|nr:cytochrome P450 [Gammaproteobacteria bacterium]
MAEAPAIQLFDLETLKRPYEAYRRLRDEAPVYCSPDLNLHVITRYDLVREAIRDTETFSSRYDGFLQESRRIAFESASPEVQAELRRIDREMIPVPPTMLTLDEPDHTRYRSLVNELFVASRIKSAQAAVQAVIDAAVADFPGQGSMDFMQAFAFPVPLAIIADRLGIPAENRAFFDDAATAAAAGLRLTPMPGEEMVRRAQLALDLQKLLVGLVEARREDPREDMISILANSRLADEDRHLTHGEILSILGQFLVAGHETTSSAFGWGMLLMCENPELQDALEDNPAHIKVFVEETLRLEAPVQGLPRLVTRDAELGGVALKAGQLVMLRYGAANRDERQFPEPDRVDLDRKKAGAQLAFGSGVHHCIGAPLARQELNLGFASLLAGGRRYRLDPDTDLPEAEASFILRNLPELHVRVD